ncbi:MAG: GWxTD domain-containing protein [Flavobacteriales bacterium]|nr:GWxTD domain-containing protein [Flavobacteriales bacterium]
MKTRLILFLFSILAVSNTTGQNLRAEFAMAEFDSPSDGPYLETYLKLKGNTLVPIQSESGFYSEVLITYHISKGVWVPFKDTYKVSGPINSNGNEPLDFIDQRRIPLKPGTYDLEVTIRDLKDSATIAAVVKQQIVIENNRSAVLETAEASASEDAKASQKYKSLFSISGIQLVDSYQKTEASNILSKGGFDLTPYTSNYYPEGKSNITFYAEIYSTHKRAIDANKKFLANMFIENADDGSVVQNLRTFSRHSDAEVTPLLQSFPLNAVPTGNYNLVIEVRDDQNRVMERKFAFFQRVSTVTPTSISDDYVPNGETNDIYGTFVTKYQNVDDLKEYLRCLHPISTQEEIATVNTRMNFRDRNMMWRFMYNFWKQRNPENPEQAWLTYWKEVEKVNATYSNNLRKGYDTDRGRVYLQYGPPNTISPNYFEPNTYPYEIWHYYKLEDHLNAEQSNKKFVFANIERGSNEFKIIHSDAKNEITNIRWNYDLQVRSSTTVDLDQEDGGASFGNRSKDFYQNPY